ncbi:MULTISPECIES: YjaG family protein [unclassified Pseudoalteromonas]|uniref:YjaG family protein n=1 Tax=unclassified Pseudoalteromonas TaxID=194690 RepID=UPI0004124263|nr:MULTISPECIES: YjaG family protein [unclassified Pseudoalteromonas]MDC9497954.1 YjaG family protein [Pseudoalteromonas sp. Angola-20]MDC9513576.1 YjaG family protein [Pseudoalteromonas sp. CST1]MDC9517896.1 YjaG family protein [Pseudoalteromonas sp. Angola-22]MDC9534249.1 YjaG family protein [Pseudoalteromonas sp. Angola-9]MDC9538130.1 YjaG family protein [Pseudoalteromonas sp. CST3]
MTKANNFQRIRELNYLQKAVLASALIERMLPNYGLFSEATGFGDEALLRSALNVCWEKILLPKSKIDLEKQVEKIEPNVPELADFDMFGTYPAIDAATSLLSLMHGLMGQDEQEFISVSKISQATVARFIEYQMTVEGEVADNKAVREHPLMQYEIEVLGELIDFVENMGRVTSENVKALKKQAVADGQTNIGLAL